MMSIQVGIVVVDVVTVIVIVKAIPRMWVSSGICFYLRKIKTPRNGDRCVRSAEGGCANWSGNGERDIHRSRTDSLYKKRI